MVSQVTDSETNSQISSQISDASCSMVHTQGNLQNGNNRDLDHTCTHCKKTFCSKGNLNRHCKSVHGLILVGEGSVQCLEPECDFSSKEINSLREHLELQHNLRMEKEKIIFSSLSGTYAVYKPLARIAS